jgi:NAD(P)-dependent dehydrogenase (short-subunit alcohol dehydrogenase family)
MKLAGRVAVVPGMTSEIGNATALWLAAEGGAVAHLASPDMGYVTGQILYVGGFLSAGVIAR